MQLLPRVSFDISPSAKHFVKVRQNQTSYKTQIQMQKQFSKTIPFTV